MPAGSTALIVLGALIAAAMFGLLGGKPSGISSAKGPEAKIAIEHPAILRSGMFFETNVVLSARAPLADASIGMTPSLWRSITINTEMPQASEEEFSDGFFRLHFGPLQPGDQVHLKLDGQINPALFAGTSGTIAAFDGQRRLVSLPVETKVLP